MWQNSAWMIKLAWREKIKSAVVYTVLLALFELSVSILELFVVPSILGAVESKVSIGKLAVLILFFVAALMLCKAASTYIWTASEISWIALRLKVSNMVKTKEMSTSYSNVQKEDFINAVSKADRAHDNDRSALQAIWRTLASTIQNILGFILYLMLLTTVHPMLFAVILICAVISYLATKTANHYFQTHQDESAKYREQMWYISNKARETAIAKDMRIFGLQPWLEKLNQSAMNAYEALYGRAKARVFWANVCDLVLTFLRNGIAYAYLIGLVLSGGLTVSEFLLYFTAVSGFAAWVTGILANFSTLYRYSIDITALREELEYPEQFRFEDGEPLIPKKDKAYELKLEHVTFRYPNTEKDILTDINLMLHPGEKIAVVGLNGTGKTTLVKLMCGLLDPTEGKVLLDGKDIRDYNRRDYYKLFSAVFQDFAILPLTIAENVAQTTEHPDMDRVKNCIAKAGLKEKIESEPKAYDTLLNREVYQDAIMLSGGETQRLMLAKALYKDAPFVILDEPTAALDPIAESEMYQKYHEMTKGKSSVYISHRLASTRFCDRILLIEDGVIAEEGTHKSLLEQNGRYAELFEIQSRYYREGGIDNAETE